MILCAGCKGFLDVGQNQSGLPTLLRVGQFNSPVYLTAAPGDTGRLFVVEQGGTIRVLHHDTVQARPFLNITSSVQSGGEQGLLSMAFDPQYATTGRFFVYFTNLDGDLRILRYNVSSNPDSADQTTADTILRIAHPGQTNHNGGQLQFGPDGMLWLGTGDGGGNGDPAGNAQNKHALLGKLLRLDVSGASGYTTPAGNPGKTDTSFAPEIWAYGLRNPWRFSFDRQTGDLYIGDVGQDTWEEVDIAPVQLQRGPGANYGWNVMEGKHCFIDSCTTTGIAPVVEYGHVFQKCSVTGGYVYRGNALPFLQGTYFYADFCVGSVFGIRWPGDLIPAEWTMLESGGNISSFGEDAKRELYIVQLTGNIWRIVPAP
jgi:glucose/arabinose dehydrogenase